MENIAGVIRPSDKRLIWGVMHNLRPQGCGKTQRWSVVAATFAIGSTSAIALCREFDMDPEELLEGFPCDMCDQSDV
jgi:hypothetical protein